MTSSDSSPGDDVDPREVKKLREEAASLVAEAVDALLPQVEDCPVELKEYLGRVIVLDTRSTLCYIGKLERVTPAYFILTDADVYDVPVARTTKEKYIMEAARFGVKQNRRKVIVVRAEVMSLSALEDIIQY